MGVLKVVMLDVGSKTFYPQGEAGSWGFPPVEVCWGEVYGKDVFLTHFDVVIFLIA